MPTNTAAIARARRASVAGRRSILAAPRESEARGSIAVEPSRGAIATQLVVVGPAAVAQDGTPLLKKLDVPEAASRTSVSTATRNTAAVARARRSTLAGRQGGKLSVDHRRSIQIAQLPPIELPEVVVAPLQMVRRLSSAIVDATTGALEKMAAKSESVASLFELVSPREPAPVLTGALLIYKGWGSWGALPASPPCLFVSSPLVFELVLSRAAVTHGCTLQKIAPYGSDPEHRQLGCKAGKACGHSTPRPGVAPGAAPDSVGPDVMIALCCVALRCTRIASPLPLPLQSVRFCPPSPATPTHPTHLQVDLLLRPSARQQGGYHGPANGGGPQECQQRHRHRRG